MVAWRTWSHLNSFTTSSHHPFHFTTSGSQLVVLWSSNRIFCQKWDFVMAQGWCHIIVLICDWCHNYLWTTHWYQVFYSLQAYLPKWSWGTIQITETTISYLSCLWHHNQWVSRTDIAGCNMFVLIEMQDGWHAPHCYTINMVCPEIVA